MSSFSGLGIGLCFLFGCVFLAFVAELYYLLWWKKRTSQDDIENQNFSSSNFTPIHFSCFKKFNSSRIPETQQKDLENCGDEIENQAKQQDPTQKDSPLKSFGEESLDLELMRLHNLCGPPRFLFTINEETKEDLETDSRKSRTYSLSELLGTPETPVSTSSFKGPQVSNLEGFLNPLYDYETSEFDFNKIRSSPPPKFKFLRDAEEKLLKRLLQLEAEKRANLKKNEGANCSMKSEENDGSFVRLLSNKAKNEGGINHNHNHNHHQMSTPSQVLPLTTSPSK